MEHAADFFRRVGRAVLDDIRAELTTLADAPEHTYVSGEFDSNQTEFEHRSTNGMLGVLAPTALIARNLLLIVRAVVDDNPGVFAAYARDPVDGGDPLPPDATVAELRAALQEHDDCLDVFAPGEAITKRFAGGGDVVVELARACLLRFADVESMFEQKVDPLVRHTTG